MSSNTQGPTSAASVSQLAPSSSAPSSTASTQATPTAMVGHASYDFVIHIMVALILVFGIYVLLTLPRLLAALRSPSYFFRGVFLRGPSNRGAVPGLSRDYREPDVRERNESRGFSSEAEEKFVPSETTSQIVVPTRNLKTPARVPHWLSIARPNVFLIVHKNVWDGVTFGQALILVLVLGILLYSTFYKSNPFLEYYRSGYIAVALIPIATALATKNSVVSVLSGVGYDKLVWLHRFFGVLVVLASNAHALGFIYKWTRSGIVFEKFAEPVISFGLAALCATDLLFVGSLYQIRRRSYTLFLFTHIVGFVIAFVTLAYHGSLIVPFVAAAGALQAADYALRVVRTRIATANVTALPMLNGGTAHIHIPALTRGFRPGQHVRVRAVRGTGLLAWFNALVVARARPFTLSSRPDGSGVELYVKNEGGSFTSWLFKKGSGVRSVDTASSNSSTEKAVDALGDSEAIPQSLKIRVLVEGPYGGSDYTLFERYSGVLLVIGGSGIPFGLSILDDILEKHAEGRARTCTIELVWVVRDPGSLSDLLPTLRPLLRPRDSVSLKITVHYTRATEGPYGHLPDPAALPQGLELRAGRPDLSRVIDMMADRVLDISSRSPAGRPSGIIAACCGPESLTEKLTAVVGKVPRHRWNKVGGIDVVSEGFVF